MRHAGLLTVDPVAIEHELAIRRLGLADVVAGTDLPDTLVRRFLKGEPVKRSSGRAVLEWIAVQPVDEVMRRFLDSVVTGPLPPAATG